MLKYKKMRKRLTVETGIAAAVLFVLAGVNYYLDSEIMTNTQQETALQGNILGIAQQISDLERKYDLLKSSLLEFKALKQKQEDGNFNVSRTETKDMFDKLRKEYRISNLTLSVTPETPKTGEAYSRKTSQIMESNVTIQFDALSDLHVFAFMQSLTDTLPGFLSISDFSIRR